MLKTMKIPAQIPLKVTKVRGVWYATINSVPSIIAISKSKKIAIEEAKHQFNRQQNSFLSEFRNQKTINVIRVCS